MLLLQPVSLRSLNIAVLLGGSSDEKEISLESGRNVVYQLQNKGHQVTPLFVTINHLLYKMPATALTCNTTHEVAKMCAQQNAVPLSHLNTYDFVFIALHGGIGENGVLQGALEILGVPYNGSGVLASSIAMDKELTSMLLKAYHIPVPTDLCVALNDLDFAMHIFQKRPIPFPCIIKPHNSGCSVYVTLINNTNELQQALQNLQAAGYSKALIQEYINSMELTVGVIGNAGFATVLPASQSLRNSTILTIEEKFLPGAGENQTPAPITDAQQQLVTNTVLSTYTALKCDGYARIDCFLQTAQESPTKQDRVIILEVNTLPALTPATCLFHQAAEHDLSPIQLIELIIYHGLSLHAPTRLTAISETCVSVPTSSLQTPTA